jgi:hypothetical protein
MAMALLGIAMLLLQPNSVQAQQPVQKGPPEPIEGTPALWEAEGDYIYNTNVGNVGVGTHSPGYQLDILSTINIIARFGTSAQANSQVLITAPTGYNSNLTLQQGDVPQWYLGNRAANNRFSFIESTGTTEVFSILQNGKVGIGTVAPGYRLDVQGGQINVSGGLCMAGDCKTAWSQVGGTASQWTTTTGSSIYYNLGNIGIGTASPTAQLHIAGANGPANNTASPAPDALRVVGGLGGNGSWGASPGGVGGGLNFAGGTGGTPVAGSSAALGGKGGSINLVGGNGGPNIFNIGGGAGGDVSINGGAGVSNSDGNIVLANLRGKVGIGSATPGYRLDVQGGQINSSGGLCIAGICKSTWSEVGGSQWTTSGLNVSYTTGNVGIGVGSPAAKLEVAGNINVTGTGNITAGGTITGGNIVAKYQDMAEWVESSQALAPGTVVALDQTKSNQVIASSQAYDTRVAGVISAQPGIALGENGAGKVLVATTGRVKVKVDATAGPIHVGDLLVTSEKEGFAKKSEPLSLGGVQIHRPGTLIGKALEPLAKGTGEILVLLSLQ